MLALNIAVVPLAKAGEAGKAGPIGLAVILLLCIVCYFLFKSMSKHMRNVRENFPSGEFPDQPKPRRGGEPAQDDQSADSSSPRPTATDAGLSDPAERPGSTDS